MTLTPQNMESRPGLLSHSIFRDIARMDDDQLGRYMRIAFTGKRDTTFLPEPFWDYWFDPTTHGKGDGRSQPSPAIFFRDLHDILGSITRGTFRIGAEGEEQPDFSYRARFRRVLGGILDECAGFEGIPTPEQQRLASFAVEAAGSILSVESFNERYLYLTGRKGGKEGAPITLDYPEELRADLEALQTERAALLQKAQKLIDDSRFGELKLEHE